MRRKGLLLALGFVCAAGLLAWWLSRASRAVEAPEIQLSTKEVSLGKLESGNIGTSVVSSFDKRHVAYALKRGKKKLVVVDGVEGKEYDGIEEGSPVFSPDSARVAYDVEQGSKMFAVVDGVEGNKYEGFVAAGSARGLLFDSPTQFHDLAFRKSEFFQIEIEIVTPAAGTAAPH